MTAKTPNLDGMIAWLKTQPAEGEYDYMSLDCLAAQYLRSEGIDVIGIGTYSYRTERETQFIPDHLDDVARFRPYTYGAALDRALKIRDTRL